MEKKYMKKLIAYVLLLMLIVIGFSSQAYAEEYMKTTSPSLHVTVLDATTGEPIQNATVLIWDLTSVEAPKPGSGIYFTDENGKCYVSGDYLKIGHAYRIYAYKGNFEARVLELSLIHI